MNTASEKLSRIQNDLEALINDAKSLKEDDLIYFKAIRKIIDFKLNEDEVRSQFERFNEVIMAMASLDFSRRLDVERTKDLFSFIGHAMNMLNEELSENAIHKNYHFKVLDEISQSRADHFITVNSISEISYVSKEFSNLLNYKKEELIGKNISLIFPPETVVDLIDSKFKCNDKDVTLIDSRNEPIIMELTLTTINYEKKESQKSQGFIYLFKFNKKR